MPIIDTRPWFSAFVSSLVFTFYLKQRRRILNKMSPENYYAKSPSRLRKRASDSGAATFHFRFPPTPTKRRRRRKRHTATDLEMKQLTRRPPLSDWNANPNLSYFPRQPCKARACELNIYTCPVAPRLGHVSFPKLLIRIRCVIRSYSRPPVNIHIFPTSGNRAFQANSGAFPGHECILARCQIRRAAYLSHTYREPSRWTPPTRIFPECGVKSINQLNVLHSIWKTPLKLSLIDAACSSFRSPNPYSYLLDLIDLLVKSAVGFNQNSSPFISWWSQLTRSFPACYNYSSLREAVGHLSDDASLLSFQLAPLVLL